MAAGAAKAASTDRTITRRTMRLTRVSQEVGGNEGSEDPETLAAEV
jgi:hypothetical protein